MHKSMLVLYNPISGQQKFAPSLSEVVNIFTSAGFLVTVYPTQAQADAGQIIARIGWGFDYIICSGGDGTVNEVIEAILQLDKRPIVGIIPSGTVNDFATSLGIPRDIIAAAEAIVRGQVKPVDIGRFGEDKYFTYVAAFGLFTDVSYATPQGMKNKLGNIAYILEGIKRLGTVQSHPCTFNLDGEEISGDFALGLITNSQSVGGIKLPEVLDVQMDDGMLEVILIKMPENFLDLVKTITALVNQEITSESMVIRRAKKITATSASPLVWTRDGEYGGEGYDVEIENLQHAIEIIRPSS